ncbi:AAA family ATPase, partial [Candidatus Poribacteria bacterium]|nr:AAA family ATPase [Candidatus Poribacteria bacterium]
PNASGKSNVLDALSLFNKMMIAEMLPSIEFIREHLWAGEARDITFQLQVNVEEIPTQYGLELKAEDENLLFDETLLVDDVPVISIQNGEGKVQDENRENLTNYKSTKLALKSAGDYGNKPITSTLTEFVKSWEFYDFQPQLIRTHLSRSSAVPGELRGSPKLDIRGLRLAELLSDWHKNTRTDFDSVSASLEACTNLKIDYCEIGGTNQICLLEGYRNPIPLARASDGTLRLVGYYILLNQPDLPPLIAIEEPERNLHPGALKNITNVLEQIAKHSQVVITTHSSQLLDNFKSESLSDSLGVLLLRNRPGLGTEVLNLEDIRGKRAALDGWIADFGIGSAIFDSELLQDLMEEPV